MSQPAAGRRLPRGSTTNLRGPKSAKVPPADVDWMAVERAAAGDRPDVLARTELWAAIDLLDNGHRSATDIADVLGCTQRTVQRRRADRTNNPIPVPAYL
jgi:hypothetical protein